MQSCGPSKFSKCVWPCVSESARRSVISDSLQPHELKPARLFYPWNSPGKNTGVGNHSLLQGFFLTQGSNPGLLHCRWTFFFFNYLSHQGSPMALCKGSDTELGDKNLPECICYFRGRWRMKDVLCSHDKNQGYDVVIIKITSVQFSHSVVSDSLQPHGLQHARPPCPSPTPRVYSNSQSLLISIELVMPSNHLIPCCPLLLPSIFKITEGR